MQVCFVTDGDNAPWIQRAYERRWRIGAADRRRFGTLRQMEALRALSVLGVPETGVSFLHWPDQGLTQALLDADTALEEALFALLERVKPALLVVPSRRDLHPDHSALSVLLDHACARLAPELRPQRLDYLIHRLRRTHVADLDSVWLDVEESARKRRAISCYASQLSVHRRKFLSFQERVEDFEAGLGPVAGLAGNAISSARWHAGELCMEIDLPWRLGARGAAELILIGIHSGGESWCGKIALRRSGGWLTLAVGSGEHAGGGGSVRALRTAGGLVLYIPEALLPQLISLHAKAERARGFFDQSGWLELCLPSGVGARAKPLANPPRAVAVMPCFDVAALCAPVARETLASVDRLIAVDDGSTDGTGDVLKREAALSGGRMIVLHLPRNLGKGSALTAGFQHALAHENFDVLITLDGDGQHRAADIPALVAEARCGNHLVVGGREAFERMPLRSRFGNTLTSALLRRLFPSCPKDTQSGFRVHSRALVEQVVRRVPGHRYETELRILLLALRARMKLSELPIPTLYFDGNRSSHFHPLRDSLRIGRTLAADWIRHLWRIGPTDSSASEHAANAQPARD